MTDEEVVERGIRAEHLLINETFQHSVQDLVKLLSESVLTTAPEDKDRRERIYYAYQGLNDLVGLLNQFVSARLEVEARLKQAEDEEQI